MKIIRHTIETTATPEAIWKVWEDVENWNKWDHGIDFSTIEGPFRTGTKGKLKPKGGPLLSTLLTHVEPLRGFVDESKVFLARIIVSHHLERREEKTVVTHEIEMKGPFALLFAFLIGRTMKKNLPTEMLAMVKYASQLEKNHKI
jgi:hypothetical protein